MIKLKCIIIDDEPLAIDLLKSYADQTSFLELKGCYSSAIEAITAVQEGDVGLIFLDINMPNLNGLDFSKTLPPHIKVIFTTAYDQYAIEGFKVNALDYLLKPINYVDFLHAANRAVEWFRMIESAPADESIFVKSGYRVERLVYNNILYVESKKDYVLFYLENQKEPVSSLMNIQSLSEKLPKNTFMRIHRSFIVNLGKIKTVERNIIIFGKTRIPVSDSYRAGFNTFMEEKMM